MLRLLRWIWERIADIFTAIDVLDWLEWKAWVLYFGGGIASAVIAALYGAPAWAIFGFSLAGMLISLGLLIACQNWRSGRPVSKYNPPRLERSTLIPEGYIPLHEAVERLHNAAKQGKIPMMGAETMSGGTWDNLRPGSEEDIYTWWACRIAKDDDIDLYGSRPPAALDKISRRVKRDFLFVDKARMLKDPMNDGIYYTDLCVKTDQLTESYYFEAGSHQD